MPGYGLYGFQTGIKRKPPDVPASGGNCKDNCTLSKYNIIVFYNIRGGKQFSLALTMNRPPPILAKPRTQKRSRTPFPVFDFLMEWWR